MRAGAEYFSRPSEPAQRRYEALRAYFVDGLAASEVAARFGYSPANVHQMASDLRAGRAAFFRDSRPGPKGPRKADRVRDRVLALRAQDRSVEEIAAELTAVGTPVSAQTVWTILSAEGLERLARRPPGQRGAPPRLAAVKAQALRDWPAGTRVRCDHAGLFLLVPAIAELSLSQLASSCGYPSTTVLSAWHSLGSLLLHKCARTPRARARRRPRPRATDGADRAAEGHAPGQLLLPRAPLKQRAAAGRCHRAPTRAGPGDRRGRVQPRLPRDPPPRHRRPAGEALRASPLAAHPRGADVLRPGPRLPRDGLRKRRADQGRTGTRGDRVRRLLATDRRSRPGPARVRLQAHHLQGALRTDRTRDPLAHIARARPEADRRSRSAPRHGLEESPDRPRRALPRARDPRRARQDQRHRRSRAPTRRAQHRPRAPHD